MIRAQAPSNIALIKYMGKKDSQRNVPENASVSLTLRSLCSLAELNQDSSQGNGVKWVPEAPALGPNDFFRSRELIVPKMGDAGIARVLRHVERVRKALPEILGRWGMSPASETGQWILKCANTFPASSGIASSASSFAAISLAVASAGVKDLATFEKAWENEVELRRALAGISRMGSGSSCRSFEGPWVYWEAESAFEVSQVQLPEVAHFVVLVKSQPKKVSSSEAHLQVRSSPLWEGRVQRAEARMKSVLEGLQSNDWVLLSRTVWSEFWEMHSLFHTCSEPFSYWESGTIDALAWFAPWIKSENPPIVTMDAGPNIHIIVEKSQRDLWRERISKQFSHSVILEDEQGRGASLLGMS